MQQEVLFVRPFQRVDELLVLAGAERGDHQSLRLAAGKDGGAVGARENADLRQDRAHGRQIAAVDANLVVENIPADHLGLQFVKHVGDQLLVEPGLAAFRQQRGVHLGLDGVNGLVAVLLDGDLVGFAQLGLGDFGDRLLDIALLGRGEIPRVLGGALGQPNDGLDHRLEARMSRHDGGQHGLFRKLFGFGFDHQDGVGGAGDDQVEVGGLGFVNGGVHLDLAIDIGDASAAHRAHEGYAGQGERGGDGDQGQDVRIVLHVMAEHGDDHLRVEVITVREQRADRAVDQAGEQCLALGGTALALEIAAGNAAGGEGLFLIVDGERKEILAGLGGLGRNHGGEHGGLAIAGEHGAVSLAGDAARFQRQLAAEPVDLFAVNFKHAGLSHGFGSRQP